MSEDVLDLIKGNPTLRRARYGRATRFFRAGIAGRSVLGWLAIYAISLVSALGLEFIGAQSAPALLVTFDASSETEFLRNVPGFFITAQVGLLAVLTVAISIVTLLSEKDEGRSVNTDVQLYYVESYAAEVATSGVAFLIVVVAQIFWPFLQYAAPLWTPDRRLLFEHLMTCVHAGWLILNLVLFLHFLSVTLKFVVPGNRARLRKRYIATEVIPRDVARRLLAFYYLNVPVFLLAGTS